MTVATSLTRKKKFSSLQITHLTKNHQEIAVKRLILNKNPENTLVRLVGSLINAHWLLKEEDLSNVKDPEVIPHSPKSPVTPMIGAAETTAL